jgi:glycosyltransferase involved in cell wall biosynthesis
MKIAIVAPCAVPYMVGGAEKLWWGLAAHFNEHTEHQAEIIKLPSPEHDLVSLMRSYESFSTLDLGAFDLVISGTYPAWMVAHPRHVCYMLHRLRGLYDTYLCAPEAGRDLAAHPSVAALRDFMGKYRGARGALPEFFERWNELSATAPRTPGLLDFPGPFARELVQWLDGIALSPAAITRYAAISATVAQRPGYFPEGAEVAVAYPAPHRAAAAPGERFDHFYTVSRLDIPKRVGLIVEAMRKVRTDLPLLVGGSGPEEAKIREIAAGDARIRFLGFESDADVRDHYRDALAVPFVPWQEDYGLIAVEAMQCARPVITMKDSGGPCELVEDGVNGFVCDNTATSLAAAMQRLADDRGLAASMGRKALESASRVTWAKVADTLLADPVAAVGIANAPRRKLLVVSDSPVWTARDAGRNRMFQLCRALAPELEVVIVSARASGEPPFVGEVAPGVRELRVPASTPFHDTVQREARTACALLFSQPGVLPAIEARGIPLWYDAANSVDEACARAADVILSALRDDTDGRTLHVPDGTDTRAIAFTAQEGREALKARLAIHDSPLALFIGGEQPHEVEALKRIVEFAAHLPDVAFLVAGRAGNDLDPAMQPENVALLGEVDDITRTLCLQACDVALNPVEDRAGGASGVLDCFAAGLPVISTEKGARALGVEGATHCLITSIAEFPTAIEEVLGEGSDAARRRAIAARRYVEDNLDWNDIVRRVKSRLIERADRAKPHPVARETTATRLDLSAG